MSEDDHHLSVSTAELAEHKSPSHQIIELVGEYSETPVVPGAETDSEQALPPLHSVVDTEALDTFVDSVVDGPTAGRIEFSYHGCTITICADHQSSMLHVRSAGQPAEPCSPSAGD